MICVTGSRVFGVAGLMLALTLSAQVMAATPGLGKDSAGATDMVAPIIDHQYRQKVRIEHGTPVEITAVVTDDDGVKEVTLYYRTVGGEEYTREAMRNRGNNKYSVLIPAEAVQAPGLEYYIQAEDKVGNMAFKGATFSPIQLVVKGTSPKGAVLSVSGAEDDKGSGGSSLFANEKKWYWIAGGVLLTGAVYAASQDSGKNKGSGETSVTISGRVPQ